MKNVLIVDDNENSRKLVKFALKAFPYEVQEVSDGEFALSVILNKTPDLIVLDWVMPQLSGRSMIVLTDEILKQMELAQSEYRKKLDVIIYSSVKIPDLNLPNSKHFKYLCYISKEWSIASQVEKFKKISQARLGAA